MTEADTCRKYVVPKLQAAGWEDVRHSIADQRTFTDGRIIPRSFQSHHLQGTVLFNRALDRHPLRQTPRSANVFSVDQEHADEMRRALNNLNADLVAEHPNYVCRVSAPSRTDLTTVRAAPCARSTLAGA